MQDMGKVTSISEKPLHSHGHDLLRAKCKFGLHHGRLYTLSLVCERRRGMRVAWCELLRKLFEELLLLGLYMGGSSHLSCEQSKGGGRPVCG